ncbi:MAG: TonB family protein [Pseudomonadales bacterium]|nr:energy transducer TonB [Pseudomonadales bacterium]NIX09678.1 TonB family protein [Pseudomonadales bacterium]
MQLIAGSAAAYPEDARAQGIEGSVVVRYDVALDGRVINARVVRSEPAEFFDDAALNSVRSWRFNPALVDGEPRAAKGIESTVTFRLGAGDEYAGY